jgi:hypothetical protein
MCTVHYRDHAPCGHKILRIWTCTDDIGCNCQGPRCPVADPDFEPRRDNCRNCVAAERAAEKRAADERSWKQFIEGRSGWWEYGIVWDCMR